MRIKYFGKVNGKHCWILLETLPYSTIAGKITVPAGFVFDGISIPKPLWWISHPLQMPWLEGAILHDYMYKNDFDRKKADDDFYLQLSKHGKVIPAIFYAGVRIFGKK